MSEPALELAGIAKTYNRGTAAAVAVLTGVDLSLARGEVAALCARFPVYPRL
jgi:lipoprotein-releasing system ATP-binding protein